MTRRKNPVGFSRVSMPTSAKILIAEDFPGFGSDNLNEPPSFFPSEPAADREPLESTELSEVRVEGVFAAENNGQVTYFVLLADHHRKLPIMIGAFESQAIQQMLEGVQLDRPMTHDLLRNILDRVGATVDRIVIDDFWNSVYYAKIYVVVGGEESEIDARPSDAVAIALRFESPIYVSDAILDMPFEP